MIKEDLIVKMTEFNAGDSKRIQHFLKVYEFAHVIGIREGLDPETLHILEMAAILHDIGIRPSEEKYGRLERDRLLCMKNQFQQYKSDCKTCK